MSAALSKAATLAFPAGLGSNGLLNGLVAAMGDSITQADADATNNIAANSWITYLALASNGAVRVVRNAGIGGNKTYQMRDRFDTDVTAYNPATVLIATGTNDVSATANTLPELEDMIKRALSRGMSIGLMSIPPRGIPSVVAPDSATITLTPSTTSGSLPAGTYGYVITSETLYGQSLPSTEVTATLSAAGSIQIDWQRPVSADYRYRIYRRNPGGSLGFVFGVGSGFSAPNYPRWVDTGSTVTPGAAPPATDATGTANYSGQAPAAHDNMIQTQKVIKKLARKYNIPLVDQYSLLTDPATGRYKQGYSSDGTHPSAKVQRLMGQNAWSVLSKYFPPHQPYLCTDPFDTSGMLASFTPVGQSWPVAGALLPQNATTGAGAVPAGWSQYGTANFATNLGTDAAVVGNAFTVTTNDYSMGRYNGSPAITAVPGHRIRLALKLKTAGIDVNGGSVEVNIKYTGQTSGPAYLTRLILTSDITDWSIWTAEDVIPPGATSLAMNFNVLGRNVSGSIAQVSLDDLTAQGLA